MYERQFSKNRGFRNLLVWKRMQELVILVYSLTKKFPEIEKFGLISQMQRAVVSVLSNFVEGYLKRSNKEKSVYMERSETSLLELDAQAEVSLVLKYISEKDYEAFYIRSQNTEDYQSSDEYERANTYFRGLGVSARSCKLEKDNTEAFQASEVYKKKSEVGYLLYRYKAKIF